jgi:hypothetical protein
VETAATRDTAAWLHCLAGLQAFAPPGDASRIVDGLPLHWTLATMLGNWGHPRFPFVPLPTAAAWLTLSEGVGKVRTPRALDGRDCPSTARVDQALRAGVAAGNQQPTPFLWGRPVPPTRRLKRRYVYRI